jgi:hypothetical protein
MILVALQSQVKHPPPHQSQTIKRFGTQTSVLGFQPSPSEMREFICSENTIRIVLSTLIGDSMTSDIGHVFSWEEGTYHVHSNLRLKKKKKKNQSAAVHPNRGPDWTARSPSSPVQSAVSGRTICYVEPDLKGYACCVHTGTYACVLLSIASLRAGGDLLSVKVH